MPSPILTTKLYTPPLRPNWVYRPRLLEQLDQALHRKLTLISAPAGFGKTTLVSEWIAHSEQPTAWLSLDERDNDATRFLLYLVAALQTVVENVDKGGFALLESPQQLPTETILTTLLNNITAAPDHFTLVLDDYHLIDTQTIDEMLNFMLEHLPPQMHVVIMTREDPPLPLTRYRARNQLVELRAKDLRFTTIEAAEFLNQIMGLTLSSEEVAVLETRTEGWIAGLQLAAISMQNRTDTNRFIQAFTGSHHFILDYLIEEVLQGQPAPIRRFLLQTSVLNRLSGPLCDAICAAEMAAEAEHGTVMIATLARNNLFVVPLDDERQWYRYHHLFAEMLQARLREAYPQQVPALHQRASLWYEQNGFRADAIHHALAAEDFARAADLVELAWPDMHRSDFRSAALIGWLTVIPDNMIRARPVLSVGYAWELLNGSQFEEAERWLRQAEQWMDVTDNASADPQSSNFELDGRTLVVGDALEFRLLPTEIAAIRAYLAMVYGDLSGTVTYAQHALERIPSDDYIRRGPAASLLGVAYWTLGELDRAYEALADGMGSFQRAGNILFAISGIFSLADIRIGQGRLHAAISIYEKALQLVEKHGEPTMQGTADLHLGLSELYREQHKLDAAQAHLLISQELGVHPGQLIYDYRWCLVQARQYQERGDWDGALRLFDKAEAVFAHIHIPDIRPVAALKTRAWIAHGQIAEAWRWVTERGLSIDDELTYLAEFEAITFARVLMADYKHGQDQRSADDSLNQAQTLLTRLLQAAEEGARNGSLIEILMLQALAQAAQNNMPPALASLERALRLAEPEGYVRIFVDEGTPMAQLLSELAARKIMIAYVDKLLAAFENAPHNERQKSGSTVSDTARPSPLIDPLSERELDVLRLLKTYLSGPEIARELMISLNTLRTHTKNIYHKLGVNSRQAAVRQAEALELG